MVSGFGGLFQFLSRVLHIDFECESMGLGFGSSEEMNADCGRVAKMTSSGRSHRAYAQCFFVPGDVGLKQGISTRVFIRVVSCFARSF